jgi:hypothetical protein
MRINGTNASAAAAAAPGTSRRTSAGTFALAQDEPARGGGPVASLRTIGGIDALVALQGVEDPRERRRRSVKKGRAALDALDELKAGLLTGRLDQSALERLKASSAVLRDDSGEPGLDRVLAEIELRVEVELAKMTPA